MGIQELFCQRKTDAGTDVMTLMFLVNFIIAVPYIADIFFRNAIAVVIDVSTTARFG